MTIGPRIYNLFPLLAGPIDHWQNHLPRIAAMGFNWVYVNPFHEPGASGSLYSIRDLDRLHPMFQGGSRRSTDRLLREFVGAAHRHGLQVMMDLVINHTAIDAILVDRHPEWYVREPSGALYSPRAVNPNDPNDVTIWHDLAEIDYSKRSQFGPLIDYWREYVLHMVDLGFTGFRCDAAYQVPVQVWRPLLEAAKERQPDCLFCAETLGCTVDQVTKLSGAGFDYLFNSSKWWDFRGSWLLDQYKTFRVIAPSIAFPETHDTDRLVNEAGTGDTHAIERLYRMRYLFAAIFSSGVMATIGYEFGFGKRLHVVHATPDDWRAEAANPRFDLTGFITAANAVKAALPVLNQEGPQSCITEPHEPVVALLRREPESHGRLRNACAVLINPDPYNAQEIHPHRVLAHAGPMRFNDMTPGDDPVPLDQDRPIRLEPLEVRVYSGYLDLARE